MSKLVRKWYQDVDIKEYQKEVSKLPPIFVLAEFETIIKFIGTNAVEEDKAAELYQVVYSELLARLHNK